MRTVSVKRAAETLSDLVDEATRGERIVLVRGSRRVAAIVPIEGGDVELSDAQAARLWARLAQEKAEQRTPTFASAAEAVAHLKRRIRRPRAAAR